MTLYCCSNDRTENRSLLPVVPLLLLYDGKSDAIVVLFRFIPLPVAVVAFVLILNAGIRDGSLESLPCFVFLTGVLIHRIEFVCMKVVDGSIRRKLTHNIRRLPEICERDGIMISEMDEGDNLVVSVLSSDDSNKSFRNVDHQSCGSAMEMLLPNRNSRINYSLQRQFSADPIALTNEAVTASMETQRFIVFQTTRFTSLWGNVTGSDADTPFFMTMS